eukprot:255021-Hanusia_phi.AAC.1
MAEAAAARPGVGASPPGPACRPVGCGGPGPTVSNGRLRFFFRSGTSRPGGAFASDSELQRDGVNRPTSASDH